MVRLGELWKIEPNFNCNQEFLINLAPNKIFIQCQYHSEKCNKPHYRYNLTRYRNPFLSEDSEIYQIHIS